ncbi:Proteasome subunit alpha type-3 [Thelohanellus kitauei]|uniref:Proteasome subunit alpha type-3 n=1 Tax=Thelohanellus kitauei TaxID=669202 RepID=A0A0C2N3I8_THEKT|nr:Proteasome subunit alpha type-3 [Thelohanellus kitauei]
MFSKWGRIGCHQGVLKSIIRNKDPQSNLLRRHIHRNGIRSIIQAVAGLTADARQVVAFARKECKSHRELYGSIIGVDDLAHRVSLMIHSHTTHSIFRPFGCSVLLASYQQSRPMLYCVDASGSCNAYHACSIGRDKVKVDSLLEKVERKTTLMDRGVVTAAEILYQVIDEPKPKNVEFELSFAGEYTLNKHEKVPQVLHDRAVREALK